MKKGRAQQDAPNMPEGLASMMKKQGYHFVGKHSATKACNYTTSSLEEGTSCYKHRFYGIRSWRCIQATPAIGCNLACSFCWRIIPEEVGFSWNEINAVKEWDDPEMIVDGLIEEHRRIVSGYKGHKRINMKRWKEANEPAHVALSLTGEPLFYPMMNGLLEAFRKRDISTFLVTNGTIVSALRALKVFPTQLYVSVQAPNEELYKQITRAKSLNSTWNNFREFIKAFSAIETRRVFRLTLIKGLNMGDAEGYARLIKEGRPHYVEVKGFVYVGGARNEGRGLYYGQMPTMDELLEFAGKLSRLSGYIVSDYHEHSRAVLLCADEHAESDRILKFEK